MLFGIYWGFVHLEFGISGSFGFGRTQIHGQALVVQFTEEQIRLVVRKVKTHLGPHCTPELLISITREVLRRLSEEIDKSANFQVRREK